MGSHFIKITDYCLKHNPNSTEAFRGSKPDWTVLMTYYGELIEYISNAETLKKIVEPNLKRVIQIVENNLFRSVCQPKELEDEDYYEGAPVDKNWHKLQPVYEIMLNLVLHVDKPVLKTQVNSRFIRGLLALFHSPETRELEYLKNIVHRLYAKLVSRRKMMRKCINNCLLSFLNEGYKFEGIVEILDILASIISGFAVPLREEHHDFFEKIILPLHKVQTSHLFFQSLQRCVMLFISKNVSLAYKTIDAILRFWPNCNKTKKATFWRSCSRSWMCVTPQAWSPRCTRSSRDSQRSSRPRMSRVPKS